MRRIRILALVMLVWGCGSNLGKAIGEFEAGRPDEADVRFRALEPSMTAWEQHQRVQYALYRGLTHLTLGDAREAERWLSWVKAHVDGRPDLLSDAEYGRLISARKSMGWMPAE